MIIGAITPCWVWKASLSLLFSWVWILLAVFNGRSEQIKGGKLSVNVLVNIQGLLGCVLPSKEILNRAWHA